MSDLFQDYVRKQFPIKAVQVTPLNIEEVAEACGGTIMQNGDKENNFTREYIKVKVDRPLNERQTEAHVGDYVTRQGNKFKVYPEKQFYATFELKNGEAVSRPKHHNKPSGPNPGNMPKKRTPDLIKEDGEVRRLDQVPQTDKQIDAFRKNVLETAAVKSDQTDGRAPERAQLGDDELSMLGLPQSYQEGFKPVYRDSLGQGEKDILAQGDVLAQSPVEKVAEEIVDLVEEGAAPEVLEEKIQESIKVTDAKKPKPITLDELNSQPGDPRTAVDIHREGQV